jgi:hypothetical protein
MDEWLEAIDAENMEKIEQIAEVNPEVGASLATAYDSNPNYYAAEVQILFDRLFLIEEGPSA